MCHFGFEINFGNISVDTILIILPPRKDVVYDDDK